MITDYTGVKCHSLPSYFAHCDYEGSGGHQSIEGKRQFRTE